MSEIEALFRFMERGGDVLWLILFSSILLLTLLLERFWFIRFDFPKRAALLHEEYLTCKACTLWSKERIKSALRSQAKLQLEGSLGVIKVLVALSPMLGLLGTVTGMITVFDVITMMGNGNARAMASGVSMATIPTMAGMVVAVTGIFLLARFEHQKNRALAHFGDELIEERICDETI